MSLILELMLSHVGIKMTLLLLLKMVVVVVSLDVGGRGSLL